MPKASRILLALLCATVGLGGCNMLAYPLYLFAPAVKTKPVEPEFAGLDKKTVAVVIFADASTLYEYPYARWELSSALAAQFKEHLKTTTVVDPRRVIRYQDDNIEWDTLNRTDLGKAFQADYVLYISLIEYATREHGAVNLFRGRITAEVSLYDTAKPERDARVWRGKDIRVVYPEHAPTGQVGQDDTQIRYTAHTLFADQLAKKFYKHEIPLEEGKS